MNYLKIYSFVFFFVLLLSSYQAQDSSLMISAQKIIADNIGNVYAINDAVITKYFTNKQVKTFSIKTFGTLEHLDVSNALRPLLFFKDFQKILFLDSQLSQNGDAIELSALGYEQTSLVCSSFNNGFWIYHQANNELIRFNQTLDITIKTGNLKRLLNVDIQPNFMIEHNGRLYLNSPHTGILVFDIYGAYLKTIPLLQLKVFQVHYPYLFYTSGKKFYSFHLETFENIEITGIPDSCNDIFFNGNFCYWSCANTLKINHCLK